MVTTSLRFFVFAFGCLAFGCSTPISKILVGSSSHRERDLAAARTACESVATRHGLSLKPAGAWPVGIVEYAKHLPPFGFGGPSIVLSGVDPQYGAVITIAGEGTSDRGRKELASETCSLLQRQLGEARVHCFDTRWNEW
jgi:hypothetical protein